MRLLALNALKMFGFRLSFLQWVSNRLIIAMREVVHVVPFLSGTNMFNIQMKPRSEVVPTRTYINLQPWLEQTGGAAGCFLSPF